MDDVSRFQIHFYPTINLCTLPLSLWSLVTYLCRSGRRHLLSMMTTHITTYIAFNLINLATSLTKLFDYHNHNSPPYFLDFWFVSFEELTQQYVSISGTLLALDRVFVLWKPVTYANMKISPKLSVLTITVNLVLTCVLASSLAFLPLFSDSKTTSYDVIKNLTLFYNFTLLSEVFLHVVFGVQYAVYVKTRRSSSAEHHTSQINHITLFLCLSQTLFCVIPNALAVYNERAKNSSVGWITRLTDFNHVLFTANVFLSCLFTFFKLRQKSSVVRVPQQTTNHAITAQSSM